MAKSMTGFGRGVYSDELRSVTVEIRSVNHRYSDIGVKLPRKYQFAEEGIKAIVKEAAPRGKIDVFVNADTAACDADVQCNAELAKRYFDMLCRLKAELPGLEGEPTLAMVASFPDVIKSSAAEEDEELVKKALEEAARRAALSLNEMRAAEGAKLMEDILLRGALIEDTVERIEECAPQVYKEYAAKLRERISELAEGFAVPEERIVLEAAVFADRSSITEELVRLKSHCSQLRSIASDSSPIGKKLDFLVQEMNREANTIGSKASDIGITNEVLLLKAEIEKIREQVQNIE